MRFGGRGPRRIARAALMARGRAAALVLVGSLVFALACEPAGDALSIAQARQQADGTPVRVEGFVTLLPGTFVSATGDPGFVIQDGSGGIYVQLAERLPLPLHSRVRVTGTLADVAGFRVLQSSAADVQAVFGARAIAPATVRTGDVGEATEGRLVRVEATITRPFQDDSPYGYILYMNDGSGEVQLFVHVSAGFDAGTLRALAVGRSVQVTGISAQYATTFEVAPRAPSDLVPR